MLIRDFTPEDLPELTRILKESPEAAQWPQEQMQPSVTNGRNILVAFDHDKAIGFLVLRCLAEEAEVENMAVAPHFRGRGIGQALVDEAIRDASDQGALKIYLEVRESNAAARRLYERAGFIPNGRRPKYYSHPVEDAVLYQRKL